MSQRTRLFIVIAQISSKIHCGNCLPCKPVLCRDRNNQGQAGLSESWWLSEYLMPATTYNCYDALGSLSRFIMRKLEPK